MAAKKKFNEQKKQAFLKSYIELGFDLAATCNEIGISESTFYIAMREDEYFSKEIKRLKSSLTEILFNVIMQGIKNEDTRLAYLKLLPSSMIEKALMIDSDNNNKLNIDTIILT